MIAPNVAVTALLKIITSQGNTAPGGIYTPRIINTYKPEQGVALVHFVRGGGRSAYTGIVQPSVQISAWGATPKVAKQVADQILEFCDGMADQQIVTVDGTVRFLWGKAQGIPQDVRDPDTGIDTAVCFYTFGLQL